ncbi:MAG: hypothetical protein NTY65_10090 [Planctomycetota bacterium]|nr:hypothetical protein [Planctomycetota bacterium]
MRVAGRLLLLAVALAACAAPSLAATPVAVFNFQMKSDTPDWKWLEKGLSDRITTDFTRVRGVTVVARDEMQIMAQALHWVPELATTDAKAAGTIKAQLKINTLVTGVYSVEGDRIRLTGQIIDVSTREEVARKEIEGPAQEVLELQRQLSAELLSVVVNKPAAGILASLPVWTRSLPATKALYEGMDLYDQGRYAEGWLKFRQASKTDPGYMEAQYWVGKMYYFMDRYEHARLALEKFMYLDTTHPRVGDTIMEFAHTYESRGLPADALLKLYDDLGRRYPEARLWEGYGPYGRLGWIDCQEWAKYKSAQVLLQTGRAKEAAILAAPATTFVNSNIEPPVGLMSLLRHNALTAEQFGPEVISNIHSHSDIVRFTADGREAVIELSQQMRILGREQRNFDQTAIFDREETEFFRYLVAPSGYVFKSLRFYPLGSGDDANMEVRLRLFDGYDAPRSAPVATARKSGIVFEPCPRRGIMVAHCTLRVTGPTSSPVVVSGARIAAALEKMVDPGAVDVSCAETAYFRVEVDGVLARWFHGLAGPLAPGEHTVRLSPIYADSPYGECTAKVTVSAGEVSRLPLHLPWKEGGGWSGWTHVTVPDVYPGLALKLNHTPGAPAVLAGDEDLRLVWSRGGDLWSAVSTDGKVFSEPRKLDLPVSSGWMEGNPRLMRDARGRFVLTFVSDRDAQHRTLAYSAWSRDFVHWSAPAAISNRSIRERWAVMADDRGRTLWVESQDGLLRIYATGDGIRWEELAALKSAEPKGSLLSPHLFQRPDGQYELLATSGRVYLSADKPDPKDWHGCVRYLSGDAKVWSQPQRLWDSPELPYSWAGAARGDKGAVILGFGSERASGLTSLFAELPDGTWKASGTFRGLIPGAGGAIAYHPRWGYVIAWIMPEEDDGFNRHPAYGPFVMRNPSLDAVMAAPGVRIEPKKQPPPRTDIKRLLQVSHGDGPVTYEELKEPVRTEGPTLPPPAPATRIGELAYVRAAPPDDIDTESIEVKGRENFKKPAADSGTVNPNALVVTLRRAPLVLAVALDNDKPEARTFNLARLDFTGKGDFKNATIIPQERAGFEYRKKEVFYNFSKDRANVKVGERVYSLAVFVSYTDTPNERTLEVKIDASAEGVCMFGSKAHKIRFCDGTSNLRIDDVATPVFEDGRYKKKEVGDSFFVDLGNGKFRKFAYGLYGHPVAVDGAVWNVKISPDGSQVTAEPYPGPTGMVHLDHPAWRALMARPGMIMVLYGDAGAIPLPAGRFELNDLEEWLTPDAGEPRANLSVHSSSGGDFIDIKPGETLELAAGSPVVVWVKATQEGDTVRLAL